MEHAIIIIVQRPGRTSHPAELTFHSWKYVKIINLHTYVITKGIKPRSPEFEIFTIFDKFPDIIVIYL